jgi:ankyrin repeat protein
MRTKKYIYGVRRVDGFDAWSLFQSTAAGDLDQAKTLLTRDCDLANAQFWYQLPVHFAVRAGDAEMVRLLFEYGCDPGQSRFLYNSWDKLLGLAQQRGYREVENVLAQTMKRKFGYDDGFDELKEAIVARSPRSISAVLQRCPGLAVAADPLGNNALHWSVITRQIELIPRFLDAGTAIDTLRADGQTPLLLAISGANDYWYRGARGKSDPSLRNAWVIVGSLLANGAHYAISVAAAVGDQYRVKELLECEPGLAQRLDSSRVSPLSYAAREGHTHIVRVLLEHGADPNQPEDLAPAGRALFEACAGNHLETAQLLLEYGANPNAGVDSCGCCLTITEHHFGQAAGHLQSLLRRCGAQTPAYDMSATQMKQAISAGSDVIKDEEFLVRVLENDDTLLFESLLAAEPSIVNNMQAYGGIVYPRSVNEFRALLDSGLDPNQADWLGKTLLHACAENGDCTIAKLLLDAGADINARDLEFSGTPLAAAIRQVPSANDKVFEQCAARQYDMVKFLLNHGALPHLPDDEPWATPLAWARQRGLTAIEQLLLAHRVQ